MKRKVISVLLTAVMLTTMLSGCGRSETASTENKAGAAQEPGTAAESAPAGAGVTGEVVYWSMWNETEKQAEVLKSAVSDFEAANPDCKVKVEWVGRDVKNLVIPAMESGTQVDIFDSDPVSIYNTDASKMLNLDALFASKALDSEGTVAESMISSLVDWDQNIAQKAGLTGNYSVPYAPHTVSWFYNKEHFEKAGVTAVPKTWEELAAACEKLKAAGFAPITTDDAYIGMIFGYYLQRGLGSQATIDLAKEGGELWNNPMILQMLKDVEKFAASGYFSKNVATNIYPAGQSEFAMGNASMYLNASWFPAEVSEMAGEEFPWGEFAYPEVSGGAAKITENTMGGQAFMVNGKTENQDAAFELLKYFLSQKTQEAFLANGLVPCTASTDWPKSIMDQKAIVSELTENVEWNAAFDSEFVNAVVNGEFIKVATGSQTADQAIAKILEESKKY